MMELFEYEGFTIKIENGVIQEVYAPDDTPASDKVAFLLLSKLELEGISMPPCDSFENLNGFTLRMIDLMNKDPDMNALSEKVSSKFVRSEYVKSILSPDTCEESKVRIFVTYVNGFATFVAIEFNDATQFITNICNKKLFLTREGVEKLIFGHEGNEEELVELFRFQLRNGHLGSSKESGYKMASEIVLHDIRPFRVTLRGDFDRGLAKILNMHGVDYELIL